MTSAHRPGGCVHGAILDEPSLSRRGGAISRTRDRMKPCPSVGVCLVREKSIGGSSVSASNRHSKHRRPGVRPRCHQGTYSQVTVVHSHYWVRRRGKEVDWRREPGYNGSRGPAVADELQPRNVASLFTCLSCALDWQQKSILRQSSGHWNSGGRALPPQSTSTSYLRQKWKRASRVRSGYVIRTRPRGHRRANPKLLAIPSRPIDGSRCITSRGLTHNFWPRPEAVPVELSLEDPSAAGTGHDVNAL